MAMSLRVGGSRLSSSLRVFPQVRLFSTSPNGKAKLLVFGGNGFLGSEICKTALAAGLDVVAVARRVPGSNEGDWVQKVDWITSDVFDHEVWGPEVQQRKVDAAVSTVGGIRENQRNSQYYNGDSNQTILAYGPQYKTFVYLGSHKYGFPLADMLRGYYHGKRLVEEDLFEKYPETGASLQLPPVFGEGRQWPVTPALQCWRGLSESVFPKSWFPFLPSLRAPLSKEEAARAVVRTVQINLGQLAGQKPVNGKVEYEQIQALSKL